MTAQSLSHQRMELVIFGPHGFYSQGLIHTIIRVQDPCQTTAQTFKLFFDSSYDHLQLARAISAYYVDVQERLGGRDDPRLVPLLACLIELLPWLKQWHNEVDPEFGVPMGDYFEGFIQEESRNLGLTLNEIKHGSRRASRTGMAGKGRREVPLNQAERLSMYIEQLDLENFRTFAELAKKPLFFVHPECDFRPPKTPPSPEDEGSHRPRLPNVTLLLGDNGSGKTTILRAIAASAFGPAAKDLLRDSSLVRHGENTARIFAKLLLHQQDQAQGERIDSDIELHRRGERLDVQLGSPQFEQFWGPVYESENDAFFVVGYGATRRVERLDTYDSGARIRSRAARDLRVQSLFEEAFSLIPLEAGCPD